MFSAGDAAALAGGCAAPALRPFSGEVLELLDDLSRLLRAKPECRAYPDLISFAFWCRRGSLAALRTEYARDLLLGRGLALHITPGNVPLNFAYSLAAGLLAGNANAVRLPSGRFPQAELFLCTLEQLLSVKHAALRPYAVCFRCGHDSSVLSAVSAACAVRVIWGGDETVAQIRRLPLPPRAVELTFADRYSACVMDGDAYLAAGNRDILARLFFQDAYWGDQLACTAPRAVLWLGGRTGEARADFWPRVSALARAEYPMPDVMAVKKREAALLLAAQCEQAVICPSDNLAVCVEVPALAPDYLALCPGSGFFVECAAGSLDALLPIAGGRCQTVTAFGVEKAAFESFFGAHRPRGIDRVVPLGRSMEFSLHWDGYDLIRAMSRGISLVSEE